MDQTRTRECEKAIKYLEERIHEMENGLIRHLCVGPEGRLDADDTPRMLRVAKAAKEAQQGLLTLLRS